MPTQAPQDEAQRVLALHQYAAMDVALESELGGMVRLAAAITGASIAAINLIDEDRQWTTCAFDIATRELAREDSLCTHVVAAQRTVHVANCLDDQRFAGNAFVDGRSANIRMYAGAPLVTPAGFVIGTVCTADERDYSLTQEQLDRLGDIADQTVVLLELRRRTTLLTEANEELDAFAETVAHDLRNPLGSIAGYAEMLAGELGDADAFALKMLTRLTATTQRMDDVLAGLLTQARDRRARLAIHQ